MSQPKANYRPELEILAARPYLSAIDRTNRGRGRYELTAFFAHPGALKGFVHDILKHFASSLQFIDAVVGIDALGFPLAAAVGYEIDRPVILARKSGKIALPDEEKVKTDEFEDYAADRVGKKGLEIRKDLLRKGMKVLILDEWIDTGGQMGNLCAMLEAEGVVITGIGTLELKAGVKEGADKLWELYGRDGRIFAANRSEIVG